MSPAKENDGHAGFIPTDEKKFQPGARGGFSAARAEFSQVAAVSHRPSADVSRCAYVAGVRMIGQNPRPSLTFNAAKFAALALERPIVTCAYYTARKDMEERSCDILLFPDL
ncbi:MAG: hypothetical protein AB7O39_00520 [Flavobacteriaceae bacterium]